MKKHILSILLLIVFGLLLSGCKEEKKEDISKVENDLLINFLKTGKSDEFLIRTKNKVVLIDTGNGNDFKKLKKYNLSKIDYLIITHYDSDHLGGASKILNNLEVSNLIIPNYESKTDEYQEFVDACEKSNVTPKVLTEKMQLDLDDVKFKIYPPQKRTYNEEDNDFSIAVSVIHGENSFLFTGDAEKERLQEIINSGDISHNVLKIPHHGKYNKMSEKFITKVNPQYAVITCTEKNYPDQKLLDILNKINCKTFLTYNGEVEMISNGKSIDIKQGGE